MVFDVKSLNLTEYMDYGHTSPIDAPMNELTLVSLNDEDDNDDIHDHLGTSRNHQRFHSNSKPLPNHHHTSTPNSNHHHLSKPSRTHHHQSKPPLNHHHSPKSLANTNLNPSKPPTNHHNSPPKPLPHYDTVKPMGIPGWSLTSELLKLPCHGWYWGPMSRGDAEMKLQNLSDGSFLVRDSSDDHHLLSLSFRSNKRTLHTRIEHSNGTFSFYARSFQPSSPSSSSPSSRSSSDSVDSGCSSVVELIEKSISDSQKGAFCFSKGHSLNSQSFPVCLSRPVSRFDTISSLQHICRFVLRQHIRLDHLGSLPLPPPLKQYLKQTHY